MAVMPPSSRRTALAAAMESGSFDAAAAEWLHVRPSAVSQRIKTLEHPSKKWPFSSDESVSCLVSSSCE
jgi:D-alanyl-D-alanine dipeptidase